MNLGFKIQKTNLGIRIRILKIESVPNFRQNGQIWLFWPKFGQKCFFHFEIKKTNVEILLRVSQRAGWRLKWAWWTWMELGGGWNELGGGGWSWVELGGGGWGWMEVGAQFSNTRNKCIKVNKSVYTAKSRQRHYKTLKSILLHVSKQALKDMYMFNYGTIKKQFIIVLL